MKNDDVEWNNLVGVKPIESPTGKIFKLKIVRSHLEQEDLKFFQRNVLREFEFFFTIFQEEIINSFMRV